MIDSEHHHRRILGKKVLITDHGTSGREEILEFYTNNYKKNLEKLASSKSKMNEQKEGFDATETISM